MHQPANIEVGDRLFQKKFVGDTEAIFGAFKQLWGPMWNQHDGSEPIWQTFAEKLADTPGSNHEMQMPPITTEQWRRAVQNKQPRTATGPDGISRADLMNMPDALLDQLLQHINSFDAGDRPWDDSALTGHIANVEKTATASAPKDYRPITVLTMPYRVWATIRSQTMSQMAGAVCA